MRGKIYSESEVVLHEHPTNHRFDDKTGAKIGKLTVLGFAGCDKNRISYWFCKCECGNITKVIAHNLTKSTTNSCGCLIIERATTHGHSRKNKHTPEYRTWRYMLTRTQNPNCINFSDYGGRGIKVCDRWLSSFENFFEDMGSKPEGASIDRINNDGNYEPSNCRWASRAEQSNNQRDRIGSRLITYNGKTQTSAKWSKEVGLTPSLVLKRIKLGWTPEMALTTPVRRLVRKSQ